MTYESQDQFTAWAGTQPSARSAVTQPLPGPRRVHSTFSPALAGASEVVSLVRRLSDGQRRDDLVEQLDAIHAHLAVEPIRVFVIGAAGQGKSSVVNALLGAAVTPVGPGGVTCAAVAIEHASDYVGRLVIDPVASGRLEPTYRHVEFGEAISLATNAMNPANQWGLRQIELGAPSPSLARGLVLIDTPAISEVWSAPSMRLLRAVSGAAAVVLVTGASTELTDGELDLLRTVAALCHRVIVAVNGTNVFAQWASVVDRNQLLLQQRGVPAEVFAVAATPYWGESGGVPPGPDSGMRALASHLEESVVLDSEHQRISKALVETFWAADRLRMRLYAERSLIGDGAGIEKATGRLRHAAREAQDLCGPKALWHQKLLEGARDLRRDIEQDVDAEIQRLRDETERRVVSIGVSATWDETHLWLHQRLADSIVHVHRVRKLAIRGFSKRIADQFQQDWNAIVAALDMASEAHALLNPRLDRPALTGDQTLADLALSERSSSWGGPASLGGPAAAAPLAITSPFDPSDPRAAASSICNDWLRTAETFLRADTATTLDRVSGELEQRCQTRGIELHRSIVEVFTTLNVLRHLEPEMILQRHEALQSDLDQLSMLDFQLHGQDQQPKLGY